MAFEARPRSREGVGGEARLRALPSRRLRWLRGNRRGLLHEVLRLSGAFGLGLEAEPGGTSVVWAANGEPKPSKSSERLTLHEIYMRYDI